MKKGCVCLITFFALIIVISPALAEPPVCDSGGPYETGWKGPTTIFRIDGTGSSDPDGDSLRYTWRTNCPGASFDDASSPTPTLTVDTSTSRSVSCTVTLTLDDVIPPAGCDCDPADRPTWGQGDCSACIEGSTCCADGTWACNSGIGNSTCGTDGVVCERGCCDPGLLDCCEIEDAVCWRGEWWCGGFTPPENEIYPVCEQCESPVIISEGTPAVITCPGDIYIQCDESTSPSNTGSATATDEFDSNPRISWSDDITPGECPNEATIMRTWTATDSGGNSSSCVQIISMEDNEPPTISCNQETYITPPDAPISFTSTATDNCDDNPFIEIIDYDCFKFTKKGKRIDKKESCVVSVVDDTISILDSGGVGDHITWTSHTIDSCGKFAEKICETLVVNPGKYSSRRAGGLRKPPRRGRR